MTYSKKMIEVALPLEAINRESAREKSIRHGHPSTLHLWWARRPLAACRAVLFASIVDDPSSRPEEFPTEEAQVAERERLFRIIEELVKWENSNNETVLEAARAEILKVTRGDPPPVLDPFCGGGSIPLEAQRLGLKAHASDLNPVAVLITKALIEIPPRFEDRPPVNPESRAKLDRGRTYRGAEGLAEDVRYYGRWMRSEAERHIGHLYPKVKLPAERGAGEATVIAWLWARTVKCPNPACGAQMPLVRSFWLSTKPKRKAWVEPIVDREAKTVRFEVRTGDGEPPDSPKLSRGAKFRCLVCEQAVEDQHIKDEGMAKRMGAQLMAIVAEGQRERIYVPPSDAHVAIAAGAEPSWAPEEELPYEPRAIWCTLYGLKTYRDLFTPRQLAALTTFSDLVAEVRDLVLQNAISSGLPKDGDRLKAGGRGADSYADAVATYLAFAVDKVVDRHSTICTWDSSPTKLQLRNTFARQGLPMTWDFAEGNPFSISSGTWGPSVDWIAEVLACWVPGTPGETKQLDATAAVQRGEIPLVATDPPYYDNIGYADLSDFFYVWLRRSLAEIYPELFSTLLTPRNEELVATPYRFDGGKRRAEVFFEKGLGEAFLRIREIQHTDYPFVLFYAFKQAERARGDGDIASLLVSTGWETMLAGLLASGFSITGTWPVRSELSNRPVARGTNALASSIVLVCRPRIESASLATRKDFITSLKLELPQALKDLQHGSVAPVDLAQASIGPGMAIFSRYSKILEADGSAMRVATALGLINQVLDEVIAEQESEFDPSTRWAIAWFEQHGMTEGPYDDAEGLSRAKNTSVAGLVEGGFLSARGGLVRLLGREELAPDWDPAARGRLTMWEVTQQLIQAHQTGGDAAAAELARKVGGAAQTARDLGYRLFTICEKKGWTQEAVAYNSLVIAWPEILRLAAREQSGQEQLRVESGE